MVMHVMTYFHMIYVSWHKDYNRKLLLKFTCFATAKQVLVVVPKTQARNEPSSPPNPHSSQCK